MPCVNNTGLMMLGCCGGVVVSPGARRLLIRGFPTAPVSPGEIAAQYATVRAFAEAYDMTIIPVNLQRHIVLEYPNGGEVLVGDQPIGSAQLTDDSSNSIVRSERVLNSIVPSQILTANHYSRPNLSGAATFISCLNVRTPFDMMPLVPDTPSARSLQFVSGYSCACADSPPSAFIAERANCNPAP